MNHGICIREFDAILPRLHDGECALLATQNLLVFARDAQRVHLVLVALQLNAGLC